MLTKDKQYVKIISIVNAVMRNSMRKTFALREVSGGARHRERFAELTAERLS